MPDEISASLIAEFKSKNVSGILDDYKRVHKATVDLGEAMDRVHDRHHAFWATFNAPTGAADDLKKIHTQLTDIHGLMGKSAPTTFGNSLHSQIQAASSAWDTFTNKVKNWRPNFSSGGGSGGGGGFNPLGLITGPLGMVGDVAGGAFGAVGNIAGGAFNVVTGGAGAAAGFAAGQVSSGISDVAALDKKRADLAAALGKKNANPATDPDVAYLLNRAQAMAIDPTMGAVDTGEALDAETTAAKAAGPGTSKEDIAQLAQTAIKLRAAGGDRLSTADAVKLIITGKNTFGQYGYSDEQVANLLTGLEGGTTLDPEELQRIVSKGGAAAAAGMPLDQYLLWAGINAMVGVPSGQIGKGINQTIRMSDPRTKTARDAMQKLGLITTTKSVIKKDGKGAWYEDIPEHDEWREVPTGGIGLVDGVDVGHVPGDKTNVSYQRVHVGAKKEYHNARPGTEKEYEVVGNNNLWDAQGNFQNPDTFFKELVAGTKGMNPHEREQAISAAFNPDAAKYIMQVLGYVDEHPDAINKLSDAMAQAGDVNGKQATATNNLETAFRSLGDTIQVIKDNIFLPLVPLLKDVTNTVTGLASAINTGVTAGDWSGLVPNVDKLKADVLGKLKEVGAWLSSDAPKKILAGIGTMGFDIVKVLFGADVATKVSDFISKTVPGLISGVKDFGKGAGSLWEKLKPILFGTDAERQAAVTDVTGMIGGALGTFLKTDLPKILDANKNPIIAVGTAIAQGLIQGFWGGFQGSDLGKFASALSSGDFATVADLLGKHEAGGPPAGAGGQAPDKKSGADYYPNLWQDVQNGDLGKFLDDWGKAKGVDNKTGNPFIDKGDLNSVGLGGIATGYEGQVPLVRTGMGPNDVQPASPPPGYSWTDGRYDHSTGKWVWVPTDPTHPHGVPPPPTGGSGVGYNGTYSPQIVIQTYPGDPNTYKVKPTPPPTLTQRHSRDLESYGRLSRPRS